MVIFISHTDKSERFRHICQFSGDFLKTISITSVVEEYISKRNAVYDCVAEQRNNVISIM